MFLNNVFTLCRDEEEDGEWEPPMICKYQNGVIIVLVWE